MSIPPLPVESLNLLDEYIQTLDSLIKAPALSDAAIESVKRALDGEPSAVLRRAMPLSWRRDRGTFFTSSDLSRVLVAPHAQAIEEGAIVVDPACGAADLLIAAASHVPAHAARWRRQLRGFELNSELIALGEQRLLLKYRLATGLVRPRQATAVGTFRNVDFFQVPRDIIRAADLLLLNPPYSCIVAPQDWNHGDGMVTQAALFLSRAIEHARPGALISAILPDVLRSGTRYARWRASVARSCDIREVRTIGQFDRWTDVDVFILRLQVRPSLGDAGWPTPQPGDLTVENHFDVTVGPVVPHRHPDKGSTHPYVHARSLSGKSVLSDITERRGFNGTLINPPFVAIRRTSRPGDRSRSLATLVVGSQPIAVENHIICAIPRDGTRKKCEQLLRLLRTPSTVAWLDERIRCRHLTVKVIREIDWNVAY